jgi:hypothetical protein
VAPGKAGLSGLAIGEITVGVILVYSGITNKGIGDSLKQLLSGTYQKGAFSALGTGTTQASLLSDVTTGTEGAGGGSGGSGSVVNEGSVQTILQQTAAQFGWGSGQEWQSLNSVEMAEAGYNPKAQNASGAYGIAQSLGHPYEGGPASNGINEYGGYGLNAQQSEQASLGQAGPQALWMLNYIKDTYGDPNAAWEHEQTDHWY